MKSYIAICALLGLASSMVTNELTYPVPRRLDTTLINFIDEEPSLLEIDTARKPSRRDYAGVRFIEQDDVKFNDVLFEHNKVKDLGGKGFLIEDYKPAYSGYKRHIPEKETTVKELVNILKGEEEQAKNM